MRRSYCTRFGAEVAGKIYISNFADHAITLGMAFLLIDQWWTDRKEKQRQEAEAGERIGIEATEPPLDPVM